MSNHLIATRLAHRQLSCRVILTLMAALSLTSCDTKDELTRQHAESVQRETVMLRKLEAYLDQQSKTPSSDAVSIFISSSFINGLFKGFEGIDIPLAEPKGAVLRLNSIKANFRTGFPQLVVDAAVSRGNLRVAVAMAARLDAFVDSVESDRLSLRIHVDSLVPIVSWSILQFRLGGLVHDLLQGKVSDALNRNGILGNIFVPLSKEVSFNLPATSQTLNVTGAVVAVSTPRMVFQAATQVSSIIYLSDGIHIVGQIHAL